MCKASWRTLVLVAALFAMIFAFAATASANPQRNPDCLACHQSMQNWDVPPVDRDTACKKCHTSGLLGTHPYHNPGNCKVCHGSWGDSTDFATPTWSGTAGSFASSASKDTSAAILHVIHATPRWMANVTTNVSQCASCHQPAACNACHTGAIGDSHAPHSSTGNGTYVKQEPWVGTMANGVVGEDQTVLNVTTGPNQCATAGCHNIAGSQGRNATYKETHDPTVVYNPLLWKSIPGGSFTGRVILQSNTTTASVTATFSGEAVEIVADRDPYRGQFSIWIDGQFKGDVDCYSTVTGYQQIVYRSQAMAPGVHTVVMRVKGAKQAASRGTWVRLDALRVYSSVPDKIAPLCTNCHADKVNPHGTSYNHEAWGQSGTESGYACTSCHQLTMIAEHDRASSVSSESDSVCQECHETYAPYSLTTPVAFNNTCSWNPGGGYLGCHQAANNQLPHTQMAVSHVATDSASADCRTSGCHGSDLVAVHSESVPGNGYVTNCMTCHGTDKFPASSSCVNASCHVGTGVVSMDTHPSPAHLANPGAAEADLTGGKACSVCHALDLTVVHFKSAAVKSPSGSDINCSDCHGAAYFPVGWLTAPNNKCVACHPADNSKAGAPHEAADYNVKHNLTAVGDNANSCGTGGLNQAWCHDVAKADWVHDATNPRHTAAGDCTSCHTAAVAAGDAGVPSIVGCKTTGCHTATPHNMNVHVPSSSATCFKCHERANGTATNNVADVHPSCDTCHANPKYPGITYGLGNTECATCHKAGGVGNHPYVPTDPNHYTGSESTHTASAQTGTQSGFTCDQCHRMEMRPEHIAKTSTNFTGVPTVYADKCIACHEQRVDNLTGGWNKTCDACHATKHTAMTTQHNGTSQSLSGVLTSVTVFSDGFEWASWGSTWTASGDTAYLRTTTTSSSAGSRSAEIWDDFATRRTVSFTRVFDLSTYTSPTIEFDYQTVNIEGPDDFAKAEYTNNGGATWNPVLNTSTSTGTWAQRGPASLPASSSVIVRFTGSVNAADELVRFDAIKVLGAVRGSSPGTVGTNCGGADCHNTADVSAIHSNSIVGNTMNPNCLSCHNTNGVPASKDCNQSGCHNGGHDAGAHTANASQDCVDCHESNNVQTVHANCDVCHNNPKYPNLVAGKNGECVTCHNGTIVFTKTYFPVDPDHYAGLTPTHTAQETALVQGYSCNWCHYLEIKPEHQKATVTMPGATTPTGKCVACHEIKVDNFSTPWNKRCATCHGTSHSQRDQKHNAGVLVPATAACGGTNCHNVSDVSVIHNNSIKTNAATNGDNSCATANCHADASNLARPESIPTTVDCGSVGCHAGMTHSHSMNRTGSNYNGATNSGCTNSGSGCHGVDTDASPDYAHYHTKSGPSGGCQTGPCHNSNSTQADDAFNNPQTCQNCHGGRTVAPLMFDKAPDVVSLIATTPAGHYNETTHTAMDVNLRKTAKSRPNGLTTAECTGCHLNIDPAGGPGGLWYQHQVLQGLGNTNCVDCHSNPAYPGVTLEITGNWTLDKCSDCHNPIDMPAYSMHATDTAPVVVGVEADGAGTCQSGSCHASLDLHELHKGNGPSALGRPDPACETCHDRDLQAWKPTEKSCGTTGQCHKTNPHAAIGPAHSVTAFSQECIYCHETTDLRTNHGYSTTCGEVNNVCHNNPKYPGLVLDGKKECVSCHNGVDVGTHIYRPHKYEHYKGSEATHTAYNQTGGYGSITSVVATEGFNAATLPGSWTISNAASVKATSTAPYEGTYSASIVGTGAVQVTNWLQRTFNTAMVASPTVSFQFKAPAIASPDQVGLSYSTNGGSSFTSLMTTATPRSAWTTVGPIDIPRNGSLILRLTGTTNSTADKIYFDAVTVKPGDAKPIACNWCHDMEISPEHVDKPSSEATRVPSIYFDKCVDCHENRVDNFSVGWDHKCGSCHEASLTHNMQTPKHDASAVAGDCGGSGCHFIQDVSVIHNNSAVNNGMSTDCKVCHTNDTDVPSKLACGEVGCHAGVQPHTHELDTIQSEYNNVTVTGCVNSGDGCHGFSSSTDYVSYHPNSGCTEGKCHAASNHNLSAFDNPNACQDCHGGQVLYQGAPDTIELTEPYPIGHYSETTHTAGAPSRTASMTAGGVASARCEQCHSGINATGIDGLYNQHQNLSGGLADTGCWECHSNPAYPSITPVIKTTKWASRNCVECHTVGKMAMYSQHATGTAPVVTATEADGAASCAKAGCHATLDLHQLHKLDSSSPAARQTAGCALTGCHDYAKQAAKPTGKSCGAAGDCHKANWHDMTKHNITTDTAACTGCHEGKTGPATSLNDLYFTAAYGSNRLAHTDCTTCHNGAKNLGGVAGNTSDCVTCHNGTEAGSHAYSNDANNPKYDPDHYYTTSHDASLTASDAWGSTEMSIVDYHGNTVTYDIACTACHKQLAGGTGADLKVEHNKNTVAFNLGTATNKCLACHEGTGVDRGGSLGVFTGVDDWGTRWTGGCAGAGGAAEPCHTTSALHGDAATKHNASTQVMAAPGNAFTGGTGTNLLTEGFESNNFTANSWTVGATAPRTNTAAKYNGTYGMEHYCATNGTRRSGTLRKTFNTSSYAAASVTFWYTTVAFAGGTDYARVQVSTNGTTFTDLMPQVTTTQAWTQATYSLPIGATVTLSFDGSVNATTEFARFDDIVVTGTSAAGLGAALPANSTAAASCSSNPNAAQCHDVTDVSDIHSKVAGGGCAICHSSTDAHPTVLNCQNTGCHVGVNVTEHTAAGGAGGERNGPDYHESIIATNAAGGAFAGTGFTASWCTGCHDDSIADEHFELGTYSATPCSMCHKKSVNSGAPTSVTATAVAAAIHGDTTANNELCTDCHATVTKARPHIQRSGATSGTAILQFDNSWSGHKVYDTMYGSRTGGTGSQFNGQSTSISWTLPTLSTWLKAGWQSGTMAVRCSDCHGSMTGVSGPHGGAMQVKLATGYDNSYSDGTLYLNGTSMSNTTNLCAKCHTTTGLGYNGAHNRSDHQGSNGDGDCIGCHNKTPHAWKRPRLIGYTDDPAPYASTNLTGITVNSHTAGSWSKGDCSTACGGHSSITRWP